MEIERLSNEELEQLPKEMYWGADVLYRWEGFWYSGDVLQTMLALKSHFKACSDDIVVASSMKTGTTWVKALCIYIMSNQSKDCVDDELLVKNPHEVVKPIEYVFSEDFDLSGLKSPRILGSHLPYSALPDSIKNSDCKIVYITRNPKDTLVSVWHFLNNVILANQDPYPFEKAFDEFCKGVHIFGPFLDHVLQYWSESLKMPNKILFLKYEGLQRDPKGEVKRLASFLGRPFDNEDEVDEVIWKSSLERLKNLEVNKNGVLYNPKIRIPNSSFFRLGIVGDWKNYFTTEMEEHLDEVTRIKLEASGLDFLN